MANSTDAVLPDLDLLNIADVYTSLPADCSTHLNYSNKSLKIIHQNIRSIGKNLDGFLTMLRTTDLEYDIIVLSECWLSKNINIPSLDSYISYKTTNNRNQNDGVVIYIREDLAHHVTEPSFSEANCLLNYLC